MASSIVTAAGKSLGSRHNSHSNLVRDDSVNEWLTGSHDNTPKGHQPANTAHSAIPRDSSFASLTDGFDIVSPSSLSWANPPETKLPTLNHADDYLSHLAEHSIGKYTLAMILVRTKRDTDEERCAAIMMESTDLKSTFTETLHVDDFFNDTASASSSPYMATTINLPGWNHGPEVMGGLIDSDVDSPEGIWYGQTQAVTAKTARRGVNVPSFAISIDQADDELDSPGGLGAGLDQLSSDLSPAGSDGPGFLGAPSRTLRSCISAPLLQRDDPVLAAAGSQTLINDYLIDVGFPQERIPGDNALGLELGPRASTASSPANDVPGRPQTLLPGEESKDGMPALTELSGNASVAQSSALFQRRAVQRDLSAPSPVAVPQGGEGDQTIEVAPGRTVTIGNPAESTIDPDKMTDEQRKRLAQLHQIHVAQQAARLGVYQDFVTPSQQFAGQEASERAAKAVQAALMYGMEGNSPRKLSLGSTGLLTPVTPQHPLQPGPSGMPAYQHGVQGYVPMPMQGYAGFDPRVPGMAAVGGLGELCSFNPEPVLQPSPRAAARTADAAGCIHAPIRAPARRDAVCRQCRHGLAGLGGVHVGIPAATTQQHQRILGGRPRSSCAHAQPKRDDRSQSDAAAEPVRAAAAAGSGDARASQAYGRSGLGVGAPHSGDATLCTGGCIARASGAAADAHAPAAATAAPAPTDAEPGTILQPCPQGRSVDGADDEEGARHAHGPVESAEVAGQDEVDAPPEESDGGDECVAAFAGETACARAAKDRLEPTHHDDDDDG
ncbi:hypothetical protein L1887_58107 [Cichorium endivia]|nr:hypothetical protein L1887_58107 [Cichorium endivia]